MPAARAEGIEGLSAQQIADALVLSRGLWRSTAIYVRLGARNRSQAISVAMEKLGTDG